MRQTSALILVLFLFLMKNIEACKKGRNSVRDSNPENDASKPKPSISTILFGEIGCQLTCNLMSQLYGSSVRPTTTNMIYCDCNETFLVNGRQIDNEKFKSLSFNDLWNYWFEKSPESNNLRNRIQRNAKMNEFVFQLMRNPHLTGNEIKQTITDEYPRLNQAGLQNVRAVPRGNTLEVDYDKLDRTFPDLFDNARSQVLGTPYETRLNNLLSKLSNEELEYVKNEIQKTGRNSLLQIVDTFTNNKNNVDENDARVPVWKKKRMLKKLMKNNEIKPKPETDKNSGAYEKEMIELKVVNNLVAAEDGTQKTQPNVQNVMKIPRVDPAKMMKSNVPNNLGDSIRKKIGNNMKQQQQMMEELKEKASQPSENGDHTTFDFNSVSNKVVTSAVDGKQAKLEEAEVKTIHKDNKRPEDDTDKSFELNAVSVKNKAQNVNNKVIQTKDNDNVIGSSKIQQRVKNGDKEIIVIQDGNAGEAKSQSPKPPLNVANGNSLDDLKTSTYYLVFDEDGNVVHTSNIEHSAGDEIDHHEKLSEILEKEFRSR